MLGYYTQQFTKFQSQGIYSSGDNSVDPTYVKSNEALFERPNLDKITFDLLVKQKKNYDVGIWSSTDRDVSQLLVEKLFGKFFTQ